MFVNRKEDPYLSILIVKFFNMLTYFFVELISKFFNGTFSDELVFVCVGFNLCAIDIELIRIDFLLINDILIQIIE